MNTRPAIELSGTEKLGEFFFKLRDYTPIPFILMAILLGHPTLISMLLGLALALTGELVRIYGVAFIGTISRTRSYSNGELVDSGPFALLRNPLYFGNLTMTLGLSIMPNLWWLPLVVLGFFYLQYIPIVAWEEKKLVTLFGDSYLKYCDKVPNRWFPSLKALSQGQWYLAPKSWSPALKSEKRTLTSFCLYTAVMVALYWLSMESKATEIPLYQNFFE